MTLAQTPRTAAKKTNAAAVRHATDDVVDRFVAHVRELFPDAEGEIIKEFETRLREEFRGERVYIRSRAATERQERLDKFRTIFNGNVAETARKLGVGRTTVYRLIITAGKQ